MARVSSDLQTPHLRTFLSEPTDGLLAKHCSVARCKNKQNLSDESAGIDGFRGFRCALECSQLMRVGRYRSISLIKKF